MPGNDADKQASVRAVTGTTLDYNGDWLALFDGAGIAPGDFNGRMLNYLSSLLGVTHTSLPAAQQAYAADQGAYNWSSLGTMALVSSGLLLEDGSSFLLAENNDFLIQE